MDHPTPGLHRFEIDSKIGGGGSLLIDGEPVNARSVSFFATAGDVPQLNIEMFASGTVSGEAMVSYDRPESPADLVRQIDPAELRRRVTSLGLSDDPYAAAIEHIAKMLDET